MARQKNHLILSTRPVDDAARDVASLQRRKVAAMAMPVMALVLVLVLAPALALVWG